MRVGGLGDAEPLAPHVLVLVEAGGLDDAERHHLGGAARRAGRDALALEVGHLLDALALDRHHMHAVRVEHHQGADVDRIALELVVALERVERGVDHHHGDFALLGADQLEIVDRAAGDAGGRGVARHVFGQDVGHAAAERIVHAAGAAGGDGDGGLLLRQRDAAEQRGAGDQGAEDQSFAFHPWCLPLLFCSSYPLAAGASGGAGCMRCFSRTAAAMTKPNVAV